MNTGDPSEVAASVIVPVYNGAAHVEACIESLLAQDMDGLEIIFVDDGSTDGTPEKIGSRVRLLRTGGRRGAGYARNQGARAARGRYLLFTDSDVVAPRDWARKIFQTIKNKAVKAGGGSYSGSVSTAFIPTYAHEELAWRRRRIGGYVQTLVSNNMFCERELFLKLGGFPEKYAAASSEDMEFSWSISQSGENIWWDRDNGVLHNYPGDLKCYLRQQFRFARDAIGTMLDSKGLAGGSRTHHPREFYLQVIATGLLLLTLPFLWWPAGRVLALLAMALWLFLHGAFLLQVCRKKGGGFLFRSLGVVFLRDLFIQLGTLKGLCNYFRRSFK